MTLTRFLLLTPEDAIGIQYTFLLTILTLDIYWREQT